MSTPTSLKKGDKVAIICPASYIKVDLTKAYDILKEWGLEPVVYPSVTAQHFQFAGTDEVRTADFQHALDDPSIKAIIAGRGGYGCVRIIDNIDYSKFLTSPKWIVGFSDITAIHAHIHTLFNIPTIHGQMIKSFLDGTAESLNTLKAALFGEHIDLKYTFDDFKNRNGEAKGTLIGGNLAILHSIIGSTSDMNYDDKILFIEDVGESHYNIDRMLWTLKRANKFNKLKGLIVGGFTDLKDSNPPFGQRFEDIILDKVKEFDFPIAFGCPAGHIDDNRALIFGKEIALKVKNEKVSIKYV